MKITAALLGLLFTVWTNTASAARWYPDRMPTEPEIVEIITHMLTNFDDGSCRGKSYRTKHPDACVRVDRKWQAARKGVWYWYQEDTREKFYNPTVLADYAKAELKSLRMLGICPKDGSYTKQCFDTLVTLNQEFLRQTKFRPDAFSKFNKSNDEMCQDAKFREKWTAQCRKTSGGRWVATQVKFKFDDPWCEKAKKRYGHMTPKFLRACPASRVQRADFGMGQGHTSTLNRLGRELASKFPEMFPSGWHYTMARDPNVSILTTTLWIWQQAQYTGCGKWTAKLTPRKKTSVFKLGTGTTYSCLVTQRHGGIPMKVGNPDSATYYLDMTRKSFQAILDENTPES